MNLPLQELNKYNAECTLYCRFSLLFGDESLKLNLEILLGVGSSMYLKRLVAELSLVTGKAHVLCITIRMTTTNNNTTIILLYQTG